MKKITYYIGAGASYNSLPLYMSFQERLSVFRDFVYHSTRGEKQLDHPLADSITKSDIDYYLQSLNELIEMLDPLETTTVDILAHELFRNHERKIDFYQLKYLISDFFVFEQLRKPKRIFYKQTHGDIGLYEKYDDATCQKVFNCIDYRYKPFLLPLMTNDNKRLPNGMNFISWNYDVQFELAYADAMGVSINLAQQELQVFPSPSTSSGINLSNTCLIKLNGTAGMHFRSRSDNRVENFIYERNFTMNDEYLYWMIKVFNSNRGRIFDHQPLFKFYFEDNGTLHSEAIKYANTVIRHTHELVVIGYSFHTSNREVDKKVFEGSSNIERVTLQVHPNDFEHVKYNLVKIAPELSDKVFRYPTLESFPTPNNL